MIAAPVHQTPWNLPNPLRLSLRPGKQILFRIGNRFICSLKCNMPPYQDHSSRKQCSLASNSMKHKVMDMALLNPTKSRKLAVPTSPNWISAVPWWQFSRMRARVVLNSSPSAAPWNCAPGLSELGKTKVKISYQTRSANLPLPEGSFGEKSRQQRNLPCSVSPNSLSGPAGPEFQLLPPEGA